MAPHLTHIGVHDHGFNNVSTYGNLWRLARERRIEASDWERRFYELALKVSGAVQARRWTRLPGGGFIHSFNGAHSLFVDTIRSLRALALGERLGQPLMEEQDEKRQPARAARAARAGDGAVQRLLRARTRSLRRSRTRRAREPVQRRQRHLSRTEHAAGLLAVHAPGRAAWPGRCSASPSRSSSSTRCRTRRSIAAVGGRTWTRCSSTPRARPAITTSTSPPPTACRTGMPARRVSRGSTAGATSRPIRSTITSRWTAPPRPSPRRDCCAWVAC